MNPETLTFELFHGGEWHAAADLTILNPDAGIDGPMRLAYRDDYIVAHVGGLGTCDERTLSERYPLQFEVWASDTWPAFVLDVMPSGAARRWWEKRLGAQKLTDQQLDLVLLRDHTVAPVGHLRVAHDASVDVPIPFTKDEVCQRASGFLEYAAELGAAIGGATGAGGDAPKVLLAEGADGNVYPDAALPDEEVAACWLVKWPRGRDTDRDRLVLQVEHLYAHVLANVGLDVCPGEWHAIDDAKPSLWIPRFDRVVSDAGLDRLAVESFYSLAGITQPGASVSHQRYLVALADALDERGQRKDLQALVNEYVRRDLLDVVVGNSDNHGRNRAVIRGERLRLAPIYDLAPMIMDPEGITRSSRWDEHEHGGRIDWLGVCDGLGDLVDAGALLASLREFARELLALPDLLTDAGLANEVMTFPRTPLRRLPDAFREWRLL